MNSRIALTACLLGLALPGQAAAAVNGISDDNLPLLTPHGHAVAAALPVHHGRMVVAYATGYSDPKLALWMQTARDLHWTSTISIRRDSAQPVPPVKAYERWLHGLLKRYPQVTAVEATNEPELTHVPVLRAAALYRAARRAAPKRVTILAGGFSDRPETLPYARKYVRHVKATTWAFHVYKSIVANRMSYPRAIMRATHARRIWITETAAFAALGHQVFTRSQQANQARRVLSLSNWRGVRRTYWQGLEACHGCQPKISAPKPQTTTPVTPPGPVLPYTQPTSPIVWDSYLISTTGDETSTRPGAVTVLGGGS